MKIFRQYFSIHRRTKFALYVLLIGIICSLALQIFPNERLTAPNKTIVPFSPCTSLKPVFGPYQEAEIDTSGAYCIAVDFWQKRLSDFAGHSGPGPHRHLIDITASDVIIDLGGHTLRSDGHSSGIVASLDYKNIRSPDPATIRLLRMASNITIRNGVIDIRGLGTAVAQFNAWRMDNIDEKIPEGSNGYQNTRFIIDNVLIKTDNLGIILEGEGNIIKNSIIESGGTAAITLAGPNGKIMNNTIVLTNPFIPGSMKGTHFDQKGTVSQLFAARKEPKAAIALHQASGSIITGNRIEVKGASRDRHKIYLTDASENVRVEGNTFVGTEPPVTLVKGSTVILKKNAFEPRKSWWEL